MEATFPLSQVEIETRNFITKVYGWMCLGLTATALVAFYISQIPSAMNALFRFPLLFIGLIILELVLVGALAGWVHKMSPQIAALTFVGYAALNGVTLSIIFLAYTMESIASTFFITAGLFGIMSFYGYTTKTDLTSIGNICFMALIGLILASVVNIFFKNSALYWITTYAGILIFVGLTAYDTQKIKALNVIGNEGTPEDRKEAIIGALTLYLDFINLFLMLLRLFGKRRS